MSKNEVTVHIKTDANFERLTKIAEDIRELVDMIPEYQHYEAREITDRICEHFKDMLKAE